MKGSLLTKWRRLLWIVLVLSVPAIIIHALFTKIIACPACYLFDDNADGLKNYYTLVYYVQHDKGWHFSGMNYPYGEHIIYTDNQPILAFALQWIDRHVIDMDRHVVGTLNMLLLLSIYVGVGLVYLLLRRWGVGQWWSLASALCIIFLSPQLLRMHGHYGLAYVCFIPALILSLDYLIRDSRRRWFRSMITVLLIIGMSLTHMYFLFISLVMVALYAAIWSLYHRDDKTFVRSVLPWLAIALVLPAVFILGLKSMTDHTEDRPKEPWGIDAFLVNFESTFFPFMPPMDKAWTTLLKKEKPSNEKIAYTGLIGLLMLPAILYFLLRRRDEHFMNTHVKAFAGVAVGCWLMAAGVVYQNGFRFVWELVPILKQFRGLGRFGFAFYYLYMLVCSYLLWNVYTMMKDRGMKKAGIYLLSAIFIFWGFEAWLNIAAVRAPVFRVNKFLSHTKDDYLPLLRAAGKTPGDFQAILQLPLLAVGNETVGVTRGFWTMREGIHASTETGLPLINYAMSRTSVSQGLDIIELISSPYHEKRRAALMDARPILLLSEEEFIIPAERQWIDKAQKIGTYQSITLYSLPVSAFTTVETPIAATSVPPDACEGWYNGFDEYPEETIMSGAGALVIRNKDQLIWSYVDTSLAARDWNVTFWSHIDNERGHLPIPRLVEKDTTGNISQLTNLNRAVLPWSEVWKEWIQVYLPLQTRGKGYSYELFIEQTGPVIDNLLIWPAGDTCIMQTNDMYLFNNIPVTQSK